MNALDDYYAERIANLGPQYADGVAIAELKVTLDLRLNTTPIPFHWVNNGKFKTNYLVFDIYVLVFYFTN